MHTVRRVTADVNVQRNRDRKVHESWLELLDEVRTVAGGEAFRRNGNPDSRYSRRINSLEKRAKIAENNQHQAEVSLLDSAAAAKSFSSRCCVVRGHFYRRRRELEGACRDLESHGESSSTMSTQPRRGGGLGKRKRSRIPLNSLLEMRRLRVCAIPRCPRALYSNADPIMDLWL